MSALFSEATVLDALKAFSTNMTKLGMTQAFIRPKLHVTTKRHLASRGGATVRRRIIIKVAETG